MIPLVLVTGFLGSGKTTLLQRVARSSQGRDVVFLVNEFGALGVDGSRVAGLGFEVFEVNGGSLFCECKVGDFLANLERIKVYFENSDRALKGAIIETSGIADPTVMAKLLQDTGFSQSFCIARIVTLVSPVRFSQYVSSYPNLVAQIETSDCVLLNKVDLASEAELAEVEERIRQINPVASIQRTRFAEARIDLWETPLLERAVRGELSACANPYATVSASLGEGLSVESLRGFCEDHAGTILRAKGRIAQAGGFVRFDFASGEFSSEAEGNSRGESRLVLVVDEAGEEWALRVKADLEKGILPAAPARESE